MMRSNFSSDFSGAAEKLENILLDPAHRQLVARRILFGGADALRAGFHADDFARPGARAGEREPALAGETIEHAPSLRRAARRARSSAIDRDKNRSSANAARSICNFNPATSISISSGAVAAQDPALQFHSFRAPHRRVVALDDL